MRARKTYGARVVQNNNIRTPRSGSGSVRKACRNSVGDDWREGFRARAQLAHPYAAYACMIDSGSRGARRRGLIILPSACRRQLCGTTGVIESYCATYCMPRTYVSSVQEPPDPARQARPRLS